MSSGLIIPGMPVAQTKLNNQSWLPLFLDFLNNLSVDSKETGITPLRSSLYDAQIMFLEEVCEGLDRGVKHFVCLKARQLGISTVSLAMDLFWLSVHPGLQGGLVTDTEGNRDKFRIILERYIESLPRSLRVPITKHNRANLVLANGSVLDYLVAGVKRGSKGLGRSRALNFLHATECSSYGDAEGVASLMAALAEEHPDRLYIFESTALGYNLFYDMCESAKEDPETQKMIFIGWWAKNIYRIDSKAKPDLFAKYWDGVVTEEEQKKIETVRELYDVEITPEQLAWYRWKKRTRMSGESMMEQEYPWTADEAFVLSGQSFFPQVRIAIDIKSIKHDKPKFMAYRYHMGESFDATEIEQVYKSVEADLRVWEEPVFGARYVIGCDPAYGRNDFKDRSAIEVYRCYADRMVQVAEYASSIPETYQISWVLAHIAGQYRDCRINLEVQGPGKAIMQEFRHLRQLLSLGQLKLGDGADGDKGMKNLFGAVTWYLYHRPDSMGAGYVYNWQTTMDSKITIMNQLRDGYSLRQIQMYSLPLLEELQRVVQDGATIEAEGRGKDDRVFATALANKAWIEWVRPGMITNGLTYDRVSADEKMARERPQATLVGNVVNSFFAQAERTRKAAELEAKWN